jgi:hypothetical protein
VDAIEASRTDAAAVALCCRRLFFSHLHAAMLLAHAAAAWLLAHAWLLPGACRMLLRLAGACC